ncbi:NADH dehydrogenase [ubiquinone] 1 alpha subcomplex assembly factor 2 [Folsomia candida]|uniref:Mimitin, mitochondrial n=1 Tax=Folsomia candida TaxID=158441 RepID=A0A226F1Y1_FOLCA|nr:NADH dehydrogenase [ubiquinone] 1 alpha subcomplex assembly factor 2 [Folsomia candida]XP_021968088.1 NADH dehydrogenase [ubiquinone] 1 alpha subcomplex assembly factor 2 [Folsomia candida]OXA63478.1 Mimitin, mitochondrial [Folsomia candida]
MPKERDILKMIWTNFIKSFRPRQITGNLIGKDRFGNQYFEIPPNPSIGKRKAERWFQPTGKNELDHFDKELPAEWESWLRGRRDNPPSEEELVKNQAIALLKKQNAAELEIKHAKPGAPPKEEKMQDFPMYPEYETRPGDKDK